MDFERLIVRVCMYSRKNNVLNLKIPAWAVLKFWGFSSLSVLRQSVLRDPTLLYREQLLHGIDSYTALTPQKAGE